MQHQAHLLHLGDTEQTVLGQLRRLGFRHTEDAYRNLLRLRPGKAEEAIFRGRGDALRALLPGLLTAVARTGSPDRALRSMATFIRTGGAPTSYLQLLLENRGLMELLVRLFASSEVLTHFFLRYPEAIDSLVRADLVHLERTQADMAAELTIRLAAARTTETRVDAIRRFRNEEVLRIGLYDIDGALDAAEVASQLTALADVCLDAALGIAWQDIYLDSGVEPAYLDGCLAVLGMGKLGGGELSYNSDLDLIFLYDLDGCPGWKHNLSPQELFTRVVQCTSRVLQTPSQEGAAYKVDMRLRPSGNQGPLVSTATAFEQYHCLGAAIWERQALIKARVLAGSPALRARLERMLDGIVYGRGLEDAEVAEIGRLHDRVVEERGKPCTSQINLKNGRGGIGDIESIVQTLQLRHGHSQAALRVRGTRAALVELAAAGILLPRDARVLTDGYAFLRALESLLRIDGDLPIDTMPPSVDGLAPLGHRLGYDGTDAEVAAALLADCAWHRHAIREVYGRIFA